MDWACLAEIWEWLRLPTPTAVALVALLGYVAGLYTRSRQQAINTTCEPDFRRAQAVARELERIAWAVRKHVSRHHATVARFKQRLCQMSGSHHKSTWQELSREAEEMMEPTLQLAAQLAHAYDRLRQQSNHLLTITEVRTDPLTGLGNRRILDETLAKAFSMLLRYQMQFALILFDLDHFKQINDAQGHLQGDQILQAVGKLLISSVRQTDTLVRYGGEEFVVVMPETSIQGACLFADRFRARLEEQVKITISGGVATACETDTPASLLARADAALYAAKSAGRNRIYRHTGIDTEPSEGSALIEEPIEEQPV